MEPYICIFTARLILCYVNTKKKREKRNHESRDGIPNSAAGPRAIDGIGCHVSSRPIANEAIPPYQPCFACDADVMGHLDGYLLARKGACVTVNMLSLGNLGASYIIGLIFSTTNSLSHFNSSP
jgi:hypothetical protein